ncbi:hypothetical protein EW146_g3085 [Bondarzewia mesenterica]|uniref:Uncharacterized protein n=1 Tax=Bondarzewia mesenterica TaxID=1095465 RepID=A0A4S4LZ29_9AGAM|nr:hypothetical protein EW146_g3085 [Bondarzewia mesenterica]
MEGAGLLGLVVRATGQRDGGGTYGGEIQRTSGYQQRGDSGVCRGDDDAVVNMWREKSEHSNVGVEERKERAIVEGLRQRRAKAGQERNYRTALTRGVETQDDGGKSHSAGTGGKKREREGWED